VNYNFPLLVIYKTDNLRFAHMTDERRTEERVTVSLPARWDDGSGLHEARIEDISLGGCFVNSTGRVEMDEVVSLEIKLPDGEWLLIRGEVASYQAGIGFGLLFTFLTDEEEFALRQLIV
jgi:hypothetical protein